MRRGVARGGVVLAAALLLAGCGGTGRSGQQHESGAEAADTHTCVAEAHRVGSFPQGFPASFPFPPRTVVYHVEDRGADGVIATGVTSLPFKQVLASLNGRTQRAGFKVTSGETEEHDAEANWSGNGFRGRWAVRESTNCGGETVVQVLAAGARSGK